MTMEEAIKQLNGAEMVLLNRDFGSFQRAVIMAIDALRAQKSRGALLRRPGGIYMDKEGIYIPPVQPNAPLTLDELRRMDGEPVWIVWPDGRIKSKWWIVGNYDWRMMEFDEWRDYGKTWVAYRRKVEEETT